jgi:capsule polysaccharide export protein KpsE/RkpR
MPVPGRDLWGWLEVLWEQRRRLLQWSLGGVALAALLAVALPSKFQSTARILPSENSPAAMMMAGSSMALPSAGPISELIGTRTPGALFAAILRSDTVEDALIDRFDLRRVYRVRDYERARTKLEEDTVASEDKKSGIVTLTVTGGEKRRVAALSNAYVEEADRVLRSLNTSAAHREREFLETRIAVVRQGLLTDEQQLARFSSRNSALDIKEQGKAAFEMASRIQGEWIATRSELEGARQMYGPEHPQVRSLEAKAAALRASLDRMGTTQGDLPKEVPQDVSGQAPEGSEYLSLGRLPAVGAGYADLTREVQLQESVYEALVKQYEISKVEEAKQTPRLRVIDAGKEAERRSSPRIFVLFVLCTVCGLVAGVLAVLGSAVWRDSPPGSGWKRLGMRVAGDLRRPAAASAAADAGSGR